MASFAACIVLTPLRAQAQWWSSKPADFEACADIAEKAATKEEKASRLGDCHSKFAGRRKPGGGYTYFDFMQNRHFDIAGPNPTPEEQRKIDEEYIAYLEQQRRSTIAAAFAANSSKLQQASLKTETEKVPVPRQNPARQQAAAASEREIRRRAVAHQSHQLREGFLLLRVAAAFRRHQGNQEAVRPVAEQGQAQLRHAPTCDRHSGTQATPRTRNRRCIGVETF